MRICPLGAGFECLSFLCTTPRERNCQLPQVQAISVGVVIRVVGRAHKVSPDRSVDLLLRCRKAVRVLVLGSEKDEHSRLTVRLGLLE